MINCKNNCGGRFETVGAMYEHWKGCHHECEYWLLSVQFSSLSETRSRYHVWKGTVVEWVMWSANRNSMLLLNSEQLTRDQYETLGEELGFV